LISNTLTQVAVREGWSALSHSEVDSSVPGGLLSLLITQQVIRYIPRGHSEVDSSVPGGLLSLLIT